MKELGKNLVDIRWWKVIILLLCVFVIDAETAYASYDTYLYYSNLTWDQTSKKIHATWSPGDPDNGSEQEGLGVWGCVDGNGWKCVDEGQEQYLKPFIRLRNTDGGLWDEYHSDRFSPAKWPIHWYTSPEHWDPNLMPYNDFYLDLSWLPDGNGYSAEFCVILDNSPTEGNCGECKYPCGHKITFNKVGGGSVCGNGVIESGEQCDDGNTNNGDGCSSTCQTEVPIGGNPIGWHDTTACDYITGWACDADNYNQALEIHIYKDAPAGPPWTHGLGGYVANVSREAAVGAQCGGNSAHGFRIPFPEAWKDGVSHNVYVYAINIGIGDTNPLLGGSPKSARCCPADVQPTLSGLVTSSCGTVSGYARDGNMSGKSITLQLLHDGVVMTNLTTRASDGYFSTTYTPVKGTHTISVRAVNYDGCGASTGVYVPVGSGTYTYYLQSDYTDDCDVFYDTYINSTLMNWGAGSENNYGYMDGTCGTTTVSKPPAANFVKHTGDCTSNVLRWKARVKGVMKDAGGNISISVVGHKDKKDYSFSGPCNVPTMTNRPASETFDETETYNCSIPDRINIDPNSIDFGFDTSVAIENRVNVNLVVKCTAGVGERDIAISDPNTVQWILGDVAPCFDINPDSGAQGTFGIAHTGLPNDCDGAARAKIDDFIFGGEQWGYIFGTLGLRYDAGEQKAEEFEYSGDVIVNPPPGFEEFLFPSF